MTDHTDSPPFLLFHVQDALHGAHLRENGLYLPYRREGAFGEHRNTSHWTVNCLVEDHVYGSFNQASDGSLKGSVVIVADPRDLPTPAGLGQVDTWFRLDAAPQPDGTLARGLSVGPRAVVIAPEGEPVPDGLTVVRYDGTLEQRDAAVAEVARARGVTMTTAGMWGWVGDGMAQTRDWARTTASTHYPDAQAQGRVHLGPHAGSADDAIETGVRIAVMVERFRTERLYTHHDGSEVSMGDEILRLSAEQRALLTATRDGLAEDERARVGAFYDGRLHVLDQVEDQARTIEEGWRAQLARAVDVPVVRSDLPPPLPMAGSEPWATQPPPLPPMESRAPALTPPPLPPMGSAGWRPQGLTPARMDAWHAQRHPASPVAPAETLSATPVPVRRRGP